jgi:hypothetical protein
MKPIIIAACGLLVIVGIVLLSIYQTKKIPIKEMDETIVEKYCSLVAAGNFEEAYHRCLTSKYRKEVALEVFSRHHERRREDVGILQKRTLLRHQSSSNIFTGIHQHQLMYECVYPSQTVNLYIVLNDEDDEYRVEGTYIEQGEGLNFLLW